VTPDEAWQMAADYAGMQRVFRSRNVDTYKAFCENAAAEFSRADDALTKIQTMWKSPPWGTIRQYTRESVRDIVAPDEVSEALLKIDSMRAALRAAQRWADERAELYGASIKDRQKGDTANRWIWWQLSNVWLRHFGGTLARSKPDRGGKPRGPCARFFCAAFEHATGKRPSAGTVFKHVMIERQLRERSSV
jgi:hypothetical protein